jgi:hypothetical protein
MPAHAAYVETAHEDLGAWREMAWRKDSLMRRLSWHPRVRSLIARRLDYAKEGTALGVVYRRSKTETSTGLPGPLKIGGEVTLGIRTYFGPKFVKVGWVRTYFDPSGTHVGRGRPNIFGPGSRHPGTDYVLPFRDALQRFAGMVR